MTVREGSGLDHPYAEKTGRRFPRGEHEPSVAQLLSEVVADLQHLVRSEVRLAKAEIREEIGALKQGAVLLGLAGAALAVAAMALTVALAQLIAVATVLPLWGAYGLIGAILAAVGVAAAAAGIDRLSSVDPVPKETLETVKENVEWIRHPLRSNETSTRRARG